MSRSSVLKSAPSLECVLVFTVNTVLGQGHLNVEACLRVPLRCVCSETIRSRWRRWVWRCLFRAALCQCYPVCVRKALSWTQDLVSHRRALEARQPQIHIRTLSSCRTHRTSTLLHCSSHSRPEANHIFRSTLNVSVYPFWSKPVRQSQSILRWNNENLLRV